MEIVSKEFIKPSSPTPDHNKILKLSLLDQIVPPIYAPLVLYYPNLENKPNNAHDFISQTTQTLKQSLSQTLTRFYPLAGRLKDALSIDCNDEGVLFVVAKIDTNLSGFLEKPDPQACRTHIPTQLSWSEPGPGSHVAMIQLNYFSCGGLAIGALFLHKIADGVTIHTFTEAWAAATRGGSVETVVSPDYSAPTVFLQSESLQRESYLFSIMRRYFGFGKTVMRRYVFDASAMSKLRSEFPGDGRRPSRVEMVSALMWKYFMVASSSKKNKNNDSDNLVSLLTHIVNMRKKADPPFPGHSFGNIVWLVAATSSNNNSGDRDLKQLFGKVRSAIGKVDVDLVKRMQGDDGFSGYCKWQHQFLHILGKKILLLCFLLMGIYYILNLVTIYKLLSTNICIK